MHKLHNLWMSKIHTMIPLVLFVIVIAIVLGAVVYVGEKKQLDRIEHGPGQSILFDGYKVVQEDGSINQYLAPEIVQAYLNYSR